MIPRAPSCSPLRHTVARRDLCGPPGVVHPLSRLRRRPPPAPGRVGDVGHRRGVHLLRLPARLRGLAGGALGPGGPDRGPPDLRRFRRGDGADDGAHPPPGPELLLGDRALHAGRPGQRRHLYPWNHARRGPVSARAAGQRHRLVPRRGLPRVRGLADPDRSAGEGGGVARGVLGAGHRPPGCHPRVRVDAPGTPGRRRRVGDRRAVAHRRVLQEPGRDPHDDRLHVPLLGSSRHVDMDARLPDRRPGAAGTRSGQRRRPRRQPLGHLSRDGAGGDEHRGVAF